MCPPFKRLLCRLARTAVIARRVLVRGCHPSGVEHLFIYSSTDFSLEPSVSSHTQGEGGKM